MRVIIASVLLILTSSAVYSHEHDMKIEQRIGLKSEEVIKNELRLMGVDLSQITIDGANAEISGKLRDQAIRIKIDRITGEMRQIGGTLRLDARMLDAGIIMIER